MHLSAVNMPCSGIKSAPVIVVAVRRSWPDCSKCVSYNVACWSAVACVGRYGQLRYTWPSL